MTKKKKKKKSQRGVSRWQNKVVLPSANSQNYSEANVFLLGFGNAFSELDMYQGTGAVARVFLLSTNDGDLISPELAKPRQQICNRYVQNSAKLKIADNPI